MKKRYLFPVGSILFLILALISSDTLSAVFLQTVKSTFERVVPSLFPYMVISSLIISSGAADILGKSIPISKLFGLPECASAAMIVGGLCGFPMGASVTAQLYENGNISKQQAELLLSISSVAGPSFVIFIIGKLYWKSLWLGVYLFLMQFLCIIFASLLVNKAVFPLETENGNKFTNIHVSPFLPSLSKAIRSGCLSCINVCGFITFFSLLNAIVTDMLSFLPIEAELILRAVLEFSQACEASARLKGSLGLFLCGFAIGWSGLSVLCQTAYYTEKLELSLKRYVAVKLTEGLLLGGLSSLSPMIIETKVEPAVPTAVIGDTFPLKWIVLLALTVIYCLCLIKKKKYA